MRTWSLVAVLCAVGVPSVASAYIAMEPLRQVLSTAGPEIRTCVSAHALLAGLYRVHIVIGGDGKATAVELRAAPPSVTPAGQACLEQAFWHLRFPAYGTPPPPPQTRKVYGRVSRVPGPPAERQVQGVVVEWPFTIAP